MGFKLKKKNTDGSSNRSGGNALVAKLQSQMEQFSRVFGDSEKSKPLILGAAFCIVLAIFLLLYLFYSVPRNNEFTRSLGDLRLLSQTISRQATEATASGTPEAIKKLTESQKSFAENLETVKDIHPSTDALREVDTQWKKVSENIDLIASQQKIINQLYDTNIAISESIPGIQAEYNLMVDQMARQNVPANQVVIAKNQVFIAERILRSIGSVLTGSDNSRESADDFSSDTETFASYLNAQLNGSADLGVERINDPEMRDSLTSIQSEYDAVLKSAAA
jgi:twitching motility protein PilJ